MLHERILNINLQFHHKNFHYFHQLHEGVHDICDLLTMLT